MLKILTLLLVPSLAVATPAQDLTRLLDRMGTATGQFEQTLVDSKGQQVQTSQGYFSVKKPGKFLWLTQTPFPQRLVSNGAIVWLYDPDLEQASVSSVDENTLQTPALLLSGDAQKLETQFSISQAHASASDISIFELLGKQEKSLFSQISATFTGGILSRMSFKDKVGNTTTFAFDGVELNPALADQLFEFEPPAGTDVIRND